MRKRPLSLFASALLFLYFPIEFLFRVSQGYHQVYVADIVLSVVLPLILLIGLIRVTLVGWYTLVTLVALWGIKDLTDYYMTHGASLAPLILHVGIYCISLAYFINPRVRHLYFDPRSRWWRTKRRYETHLPFIMNHKGEWHYPILRDISEGGCFIETSHLAEINTKVELAIPLPEPLEVSVIHTEGEVRWVSKNPHRFGMGVQFNPASDIDRDSLKEFVRKHVWF